MNHRATPRFWSCYRRLTEEVQRLADRSYELLRNDPRHPSLHLKTVGSLWSVRVGLHYRALAVEDGVDLIWVWIGSHAEYDRLVQMGRS
jgi:hypothetical protein